MTKSVRGVTLIEMIVVITITGIIAAAVAVFIRRPVEGYVDSAQRAALTDLADTALRRIIRDVRAALPNSLRLATVSGVTYIEFLQTSGGGRYRAEVDSGGGGDILDFTNPAGDGSFDVIGPLPTLTAGNLIAIYNLGPGTGSTDAYTGGNTAAFSGVAAPTITISAKQFPFSSPARRFQVIQYPVTYACNPATGELRRYWGYTISAAQPTPPATPNNALLAQNVTSCGFTYTAVTQREGVLALSLQVSQNGDNVRLFNEVHVSNVP